jgi:hypothetical protein
MKKRVNFIILSILILLSFLFPICSAQTQLSYGLSQGILGVADIIISVFTTLFSLLLGSSQEILYEKILFFFIISSLVYVSINRIKVGDELYFNNNAVRWIIILSVSLLATRFLTEIETVKTMLLPYSVLGVVITAFFPLIIGYYFITNSLDAGILRRSFWIFFTIVYLFLWRTRYSELGMTSWIYAFTAIISFIFFLFDGTIRNILLKQEAERQGVTMDENYRENYKAKLSQERTELTTNAAHYSPAYVKKRLRDIESTMRTLKKR